MSRRIQIVSITQSGVNPGTFLIGATPDNLSGDWTPVFQGEFYRDSAGNTQPRYSSPTPPSGYSLIVATQFDVVENSRYAGRYTVYTTPTMGGLASSTFSAGQTTIRVNETIGAPNVPADLTSGYITNVSTYYLVQPTAAAIIVPPGVELSDKPISFSGRFVSGWGEVNAQNHLSKVSNFAGPTSPTSPFTGMTWFDTSTGLMKVWDSSSWVVINSSYFAPANSYRHTQAGALATWTVTHNLGAAAPFIVHHTFFVDTGGAVYKPIIPSDVTYVSANQLTVTFSSAYSGFALVRL